MCDYFWDFNSMFTCILNNIFIMTVKVYHHHVLNHCFILNDINSHLGGNIAICNLCKNENIEFICMKDHWFFSSLLLIQWWRHRKRVGLFISFKYSSDDSMQPCPETRLLFLIKLIYSSNIQIEIPSIQSLFNIFIFFLFILWLMEICLMLGSVS